MLNSNQRRDVRYRICAGVALVVGRRNIVVTTGDIGLRGLFVRTSETFRDNEFVRLSLRVPWANETLSLYGRIAHLRGSNQVGVGIALYANARPALEVWESFVKQAAQRYPNSLAQDIHVPPPLPAGRVY